MSRRFSCVTYVTMYFVRIVADYLLRLDTLLDGLEQELLSISDAPGLAWRVKLRNYLWISM